MKSKIPGFKSWLPFLNWLIEQMDTLSLCFLLYKLGIIIVLLLPQIVVGVGDLQGPAQGQVGTVPEGQLELLVLWTCCRGSFWVEFLRRGLLRRERLSEHEEDSLRVGEDKERRVLQKENLGGRRDFFFFFFF